MSDLTPIFLDPNFPDPNFPKMQFMMREQMSIQVANELFAGTGEIGFICHARADVAVMYPKAIAVVTGVR